MAIADTFNGTVDKLKQDIAARTDEVKDQIKNNLKKDMAEESTLLEVREHVGYAMMYKTSKMNKIY